MRALGALGAALGASAFLLPVGNPDVYWHLSAGRYMFDHGRIPTLDHLSYTMADRPWIAFEWLAELLYFHLHSHFACGGLFALRVALLCGALFFVWRFLALHGCGPAARGLAALAAGASIAPSADVRPENFSLLFFTALLFTLEAHRLERFKPRALHLAAAAAFFCLWANLHLGLFYGLVLIAFYLAGEVLAGRRAAARRLAALLACGALAVMANPIGAWIYVFVFKYARALPSLHNTICEYKPADIAARLSWGYWALLLSAGLAAARRWKTVPAAHLLALGFFGLASLLAKRDLPYFCLAAAPIFFSINGGPSPALRRVLAAFFAAFLALVVWPMAASRPLGRCAPPGERLADFLERETAALGGKRLFNLYEQGGYLGWRLWPAYRVFYDGRLHLFERQLEESRDALKSPAAWQAYVDAQGIDLVCFRRSSVGAFLENGVQRPYYVNYLPVKNWALVYWDANDLALVRRSTVPRAWLKRREFVHLRPDDYPTLFAQAGRAAARAEAPRLIEQAGGLFDPKDAVLFDWLKH